MGNCIFLLVELDLNHLLGSDAIRLIVHSAQNPNYKNNVCPRGLWLLCRSLCVGYSCSDVCLVSHSSSSPLQVTMVVMMMMMI